MPTKAEEKEAAASTTQVRLRQRGHQPWRPRRHKLRWHRRRRKAGKEAAAKEARDHANTQAVAENDGNGWQLTSRINWL